jgi:hypothetical protein
MMTFDPSWQLIHCIRIFKKHPIHKNMILSIRNLKTILLYFLFILSMTAVSEINAQSINGIYSDGEVSLHLEETSEGVIGLFADSDGSYYEAVFIPDEEGLIGLLGEYYAYIPFETEELTLIVMPMDGNEEPIVDQAVEYVLSYISALQKEVQQADYSQLNWAPIKRFGSDFYPSYVLATSTWAQNTTMESEEYSYNYYGDRNGYFGIQIDQFPIGSIVRVEIEGEPLARKSSYTITVSKDGLTEIFPIMEYDYDALREIKQAKAVNFKYAIYLNNELFGETLEVVWTRSINDAVFIGQDHHGNTHALNFIFAAYVNENEPDLDIELGKMLDHKIVNSWIGYQGSEQDVMNQVFTMWYHFQKQGFKYSSITTQSGSDDRSSGQVVRFVKDALQSSQANCIDGTVLFASFLYKIGIDVSIVLVPGHAYLAFCMGSDGTKKLALETTSMGSVDIENLSSTDGQRTDVKLSYDSFLSAIDYATKAYYEKAEPGIKQGDPQYMEINIKEAREQKVRPIK